MFTQTLGRRLYYKNHCVQCGTWFYKTYDANYCDGCSDSNKVNTAIPIRYRANYHGRFADDNEIYREVGS